MTDNEYRGERAPKSEFEISGQKILQRAKELVQQGNARRVTIRRSNGQVLLNTNMTVGVAATSILALASPPLAVLAAAGGLLARLRVEVAREDRAERQIAEPRQDDNSPL